MHMCQALFYVLTQTNSFTYQNNPLAGNYHHHPFYRWGNRSTERWSDRAGIEHDVVWLQILQFCLLWVLKWAMVSAPLEKAMATRSSTLAWKIPWTEEPGRLRSMGSPRVGHDWATSLSLFTFMHWRRKWQPTLVLLPGESQGWGSLVGCHLWGHTE